MPAVPTADVDRLLFRNLPTSELHKVNLSEVNLSNSSRYYHGSDDEWSRLCCVVNSPIYLYIDKSKRSALAVEIFRLTSRYLHLSTDNRKFLGSAQPRIMHMADLIAAMTNADIDTVSGYCFGQKSRLQNYEWLDTIEYRPFVVPNPTTIEVDIGFFLQLRDFRRHILLLKLENRPFRRCHYKTYPILYDLAHEARNDDALFGSLQMTWSNPLVSKIKIYQSFTHLFKAVTPKSFTSLPMTVKKARNTIAQIRQFQLHLEHLTRTGADEEAITTASSIRMEFSFNLEHGQLMIDTEASAKSLCDRILDNLIVMPIPLAEVPVEMNAWLTEMELYRVRQGSRLGRETVARDKLDILAHALSAAGVCTDAISQRLKRRQPNGLYHWQSALATRRRPLPDRPNEDVPIG